MRRFWRGAALITLLSFVGLSAAQAFHDHVAVDATSHCGLCKITQQTPVLTHVEAPLTTPFFSRDGECPSVVWVEGQFVLTATGLSPPLAS